MLTKTDYYDCNLQTDWNLAISLKHCSHDWETNKTLSTWSEVHGNLRPPLWPRVGVNSAPELDFLANSKSNSGIGIELELALLSPGGIGIELELPSLELESELLSSELNSELPSWN